MGDFDDDDAKRIVLAAVDERDDTPTEPHSLRQAPRGCLRRDGVVLVAGNTLSGARAKSNAPTKDPPDFVLRRIHPPAK